MVVMFHAISVFEMNSNKIALLIFCNSYICSLEKILFDRMLWWSSLQCYNVLSEYGTVLSVLPE